MPYFIASFGEKRHLQNCKDKLRVIDYTGGMSTYDRELLEKLQRLESIEARLIQHEKKARFGLMWLSLLGATLLVVLLYHVTSL